MNLQTPTTSRELNWDKWTPAALRQPISSNLHTRNAKNKCINGDINKK